MGLTAAVTPKALRGVVLFCGLYDMRTVSGSGFPALRTYLWAYLPQARIAFRRTLDFLAAVTGG